MIGVIGVLTKKGLADFYEIFKDYENARNPRYRPAQPDVPFPGKGNIRDPEYRRELRRVCIAWGWASALLGVGFAGLIWLKRGLTTLDVSIKAVGVWDTVGRYSKTSPVRSLLRRKID